MSDNNNKIGAHPGDDCMTEYWTRAFGLSAQRMMELIERVVAEQHKVRDLQRQRRLMALPIEGRDLP